MPRIALALRWNRLPLLHKILAGALSLAVVAVSLALPRHSLSKFRSSALLSFDPITQGKPASEGEQFGGKSAKEYAESILNTDAAGRAAGQAGSRLSALSGDRMAQSRDHLTLNEIPPSKLGITWQDDSPDRAIASANAVTQLLTSWVPADAGIDQQQTLISPSLGPSPANLPTASKPYGVAAQRDMRRTGGSHEILVKEQTELLSQIDKADHRLAELEAERRRLDAIVQQAKTANQRPAVARQSLETQVAAAKKRLEELRARYTDDYPDVQDAGEHLAEVEGQLAASPAERQTTTSDQARLDATVKEILELRSDRAQLLQRLIDAQSADKDFLARQAGNEVSAPGASQGSTATASNSLKVVQKPISGTGTEVRSAATKAAGEVPQAPRSPFGVLEPAGVAQRVEEPQPRLQWPGIALGVFSGLLYLTVALWWFRPVEGVAALEQILPSRVAFVGAIPRINR